MLATFCCCSSLPWLSTIHNFHWCYSEFHISSWNRAYHSCDWVSARIILLIFHFWAIYGFKLMCFLTFQNGFDLFSGPRLCCLNLPWFRTSTHYLNRSCTLIGFWCIFLQLNWLNLRWIQSWESIVEWWICIDVYCEGCLFGYWTNSFISLSRFDSSFYSVYHVLKFFILLKFHVFVAWFHSFLVLVVFSFRTFWARSRFAQFELYAASTCFIQSVLLLLQNLLLIIWWILLLFYIFNQK